jgi:two-component system sensor histidine kinase KdpD
VSDIVGSAIRGLASRLANNEVRFEQEPGLPMIEVDFVLMEQVFINLIDNAAKHSPPGAPIRIVAMHDAGNIVLRFIDEGIGVPKEDLERIFDKFFRVQRGDRQMAGTGLGLSICRGIVEEHGGRMFATSPAAGGKGTEVTVILPIGSQPPASTVEPEEQ